MAYQVLLMRFRDGEVVAVPSQPLLEVLRAHSLDPGEEAEYVELRDGLSVELFTDAFSQVETQEIAIAFRSTSEELHKLIYDLMAAGMMTALLVDNPTVPLVCSRESCADLPESDMAEPVICQSATDVGQALDPLCQRWAKWAGIE